MSCPHCLEKDGLIKELEQALEGAVFPSRDDASILTIALSISLQQAQLIALLFRARGRPLNTRDLDEALPKTARFNPTRAGLGADEPRRRNFSSVIAHNTRAKLGHDFIVTKPWEGYLLSAAARERVAAILKERP